MSSTFDKIMNFSSVECQEKYKGMKKSEIYLDRLKDSYDLTDLEEVLKVRGNQLIISVAGSGKTTSLLLKIQYDIITGEATKSVDIAGTPIKVIDNIWVCTFLKSGAEELKKTLSQKQRDMGYTDTSDSIEFSTLHAEFKRCLNALGIKTNLINEKDNLALLRQACIQCCIKNDRGNNLNSDDLKNLSGALTYTRNRLDVERYNKQAYTDFCMTPADVDRLLKTWKELRKKSMDSWDFEDLQEALYYECYENKNEHILNFVRNRYNYIYIDEFQDTSQLQYALLKIYAEGANKIVAIGDDDQTIYSFRGSYSKIITTLFINDFDPIVSTLSKNFRCPSNILNAIVPSIELNKDRYKKEIKSHREGGLVQVCTADSYTELLEKLSKNVENDINEGKKVAILCRVNSDGLLPALMFDKMASFSYSISGDSMTLDSYVAKTVINIARLFTDKYSDAVKQSINSLGWNASAGLIEVCRNNNLSFWDIPDEDLQYSSPQIYDRLKSWKDFRKRYGDIDTLKAIYFDYREDVYNKPNQFNSLCRSVIESFETLLETVDYESVESFLEDIGNINERLKARRNLKRNVMVKIATVHEFKGKQANSVYIWNDSQGVFPHKLSYTGGNDELEEERRVHYIACTRAKDKSTLMFINGKSGMFVEEMDLSNAVLI